MKKLLRLFSFVIPFLLLGALLLVVDIPEMTAALTHVDVFFYVAAFGLYTLSFATRAIRLSIGFGKGSFGNYFMFICGHMLLNHVLPFRTGEVSLPFFLKRISGIPYSKSIAFFVLLRLFDMIAIFVSLLMVLMLLGARAGVVNITIMTVILTLCVLAAVHLKRWFPALMRVSIKWLPEKFSGKLTGVSNSMKDALTLSHGKMAGLFFLSLFDRLFNYGVTVLLVVGMGYAIPVLQLMVANAAASLTNILPINSIGSFGTLELGWTGALMSYGVSADIAAASGLGFHLLFLSYTIILGVTALIIMKIKYRHAAGPVLHALKKN